MAAITSQIKSDKVVAYRFRACAGRGWLYCRQWPLPNRYEICRTLSHVCVIISQAKRWYLKGRCTFWSKRWCIGDGIWPHFSLSFLALRVLSCWVPWYWCFLLLPPAEPGRPFANHCLPPPLRFALPDWSFMTAGSNITGKIAGSYFTPACSQALTNHSWLNSGRNLSSL